MWPIERMNRGLRALALLICLVLCPLLEAQQEGTTRYLVGSGIYDITGPVADLMMQGYVDFKQTTHGIHTRLWSRAFIVVEPASGRRVVLVTIDQIHQYQVVTQRVVARLRETFGDLYTDRNVLIAATHTHSAPGGFSHYFLYYVSTLGYSQQNLDAVVEGVYQSIVQAHRNLAPGTMRIARGELLEASVNRAPEAYVLNPAAERARYPHDVDKEMTVLRLEQDDGSEVGAIAWFAVHATSMQRENRLISGDNKGYAAYLFEKAKGTRYDAAAPFVAAFPNSNAGDASPSIGRDLNGDRNWDCPALDSVRCTELSGGKQFKRARELYDGATEALAGPIDYRHAYVDFSKVSLEPALTDGAPHQTCSAAIGISMLAGTKDGIGVGREGRTCQAPTGIARLLCLRSRCQGAKPVVISLGTKRPYPWTPDVLPVQLIRLGQLVLVAVPAEFTTMSGRRLRETVLEALEPAGVRYAVLAGYANAYAGYVATREEYQRQNYEGASTHFGEWTLAAYQQEAGKLARAMAAGTVTAEGPVPRDLTGHQYLRWRGHPRRDSVPSGKVFGSVLRDAGDHYAPGELVRVQFWGAYPNHDLMTRRSYLEVQRQVGAGWEPVAYDWDEETKYIWRRKGLHRSVVTVEWQIPVDALTGQYRIVIRGQAKTSRHGLTPYQGASRSFEVGAPVPAGL